jgi:UDP-N-acetylglucosamine 1-carboxyvinyltransferase
MDKIRVIGGNELNGVIPISGAKNAALPLIIASLLTEETLILDNVPRLADVAQLKRIISNHGVDIMLSGKRVGAEPFAGETLKISAKNIVDTTAPYELVSTMRASFWVIGPLLARMKQCRVSLPGGCAIGTRPVDLFLMALEKMGATLELDGGYVNASAPEGLKGCVINFPKVSVGATHVAMMAATLAKGVTILENAAQEPEVTDLARCLIAMGAKITGLGTSTLKIEGVEKLHGARHSVVADRIEAGTYACAVAMTGGEVLLKGVTRDLLEEAFKVLEKAGVKVTQVEDGVAVSRARSQEIHPVNVTTDPFPGFPTDLQAQFMAVMTMAKGKSRISETIFENRFMHVQELARFGAKITLDGIHAHVSGVDSLNGAPVMATDLRASACLIIAALVAKGESFIHRVYHLDRGFERLEDKLSACGANIARISG